MASQHPTPPLAEGEARKKHFLALLKSLNTGIGLALLLTWSQVEAILGAIIDAQRTAFLHLPMRAAAVLAGGADQVRIIARLTEMVHQILSELAETEFVPVDGQLVQRAHRSGNVSGHG